ncbi:glycoside hydrolase domain-containing protein [Longimicrobium sp.]|jgi:hypothetical protein|uniref:glycoside hydrolase domain-containing protein n=1 Tax=Longimicrobium sp. TaxID=2029185 RepID=UPI002F92B528
MPLAGNVTPAPAGLRGFDANTPISAAAARAFWDAGYRFALRYVGRTQMASHDLTTAEAEILLNQGFGLMPVQHVLDPGWQPTTALGQEYGANAATFSQQIGFPPGVNVWCDLESVSHEASAADVIGYCNAWYTAVANAGYVPGLYVGYEPGLTGQQLYGSLKFSRYWAAYNVDGVSNPKPRSWQLVQMEGSGTVGGLSTEVYDADETRTDGEGSTPVWLQR